MLSSSITMSQTKRMSTAYRRITKELQLMRENPDTEICANPAQDADLLNWIASIKGPADTPYEGGLFQVSIALAATYPFTPPKVRFTTPIFHPNISSDGRICLDILNTMWSPALTISKVLMSILSLLSDPNPDDPLVFRTAELYRSDREGFNVKAQNWTRKYARLQLTPN